MHSRRSTPNREHHIAVSRATLSHTNMHVSRPSSWHCSLNFQAQCCLDPASPTQCGKRYVEDRSLECFGSCHVHTGISERELSMKCTRVCVSSLLFCQKCGDEDKRAGICARAHTHTHRKTRTNTCTHGCISPGSLLERRSGGTRQTALTTSSHPFLSPYYFLEIYPCAHVVNAKFYRVCMRARMPAKLFSSPHV